MNCAHGNIRPCKNPVISTFIAIDFETANRSRDSACALGVVICGDGQVLESFDYLIKLPDVCSRLNIPLRHHDAASDARACAEIVLAAQREGWVR